MTKDDALKLALDALEKYCTPYLDGTHPADEAITAIKAALAQPTSGDYALGYSIGFGDGHSTKQDLAQPKQEPLADEQIELINGGMCGEREFYQEFARAIEAAHNIKE